MIGQGLNFTPTGTCLSLHEQLFHLTLPMLGEPLELLQKGPEVQETLFILNICLLGAAERTHTDASFLFKFNLLNLDRV